MKYNIIYADPPWAFSNSRKSRPDQNTHELQKKIEEFYPTMTTKELCALPVKNICADDAICFMWVCDGFIHDAIHIIETWGFTYRVTAFIWKKNLAVTPGMWTMKNCEFIILGTKGRMHKYLLKRNIQQFIETPRIGIHSQKPEIFRTKIVEMFGNELPKIELFARHKTEGWDIWGNELENSITLNSCV